MRAPIADVYHIICTRTSYGTKPSPSATLVLAADQPLVNHAKLESARRPSSRTGQFIIRQLLSERSRSKQADKPERKQSEGEPETITSRLHWLPLPPADKTRQGKGDGRTDGLEIVGWREDRTYLAAKNTQIRSLSACGLGCEEDETPAYGRRRTTPVNHNRRTCSRTGSEHDAFRAPISLEMSQARNIIPIHMYDMCMSYFYPAAPPPPTAAAAQTVATKTKTKTAIGFAPTRTQPAASAACSPPPPPPPPLGIYAPILPCSHATNVCDAECIERNLARIHMYVCTPLRPPPI